MMNATLVKIRMKNVVAKMKLKAIVHLTTRSKKVDYSLEDFLGAESVL